MRLLKKRQVTRLLLVNGFVIAIGLTFAACKADENIEPSFYESSVAFAATELNPSETESYATTQIETISPFTTSMPRKESTTTKRVETPDETTVSSTVTTTIQTVEYTQELKRDIVMNLAKYAKQVGWKSITVADGIRNYDVDVDALSFNDKNGETIILNEAGFPIAFTATNYNEAMSEAQKMIQSKLVPPAENSTNPRVRIYWSSRQINTLILYFEIR